MTPETAKTCTAVVNGKEVTGFQSILDAKQSAGTKDTSPLDFRIVGCVTADDVDHFSSSAEGIQLKGKSAYTFDCDIHFGVSTLTLQLNTFC